jgi:hypothetical protein
VKGPKDKLAVRYFDDDNTCLAESYSITLNNGGSQQKERVTSAVVILNDKILYKQSDFNRRFTGDSKTLPKALIIEDGNVLEVKVNGKPGASISVGIYGHYSGSGSGGSNQSGDAMWYLDLDGDGYGGSIMVCQEEDAQDCPEYEFGVWDKDGGDCKDNPFDSSVSNPEDYFPGQGCPSCW